MKGGKNLEDHNIVDLYWFRDENAISETDKKYGSYCNTIANNILYNLEDSKECVNDTYLKAHSQTDGVLSYGRMVDLMLADFSR